MRHINYKKWLDRNVLTFITGYFLRMSFYDIYICIIVVSNACMLYIRTCYKGCSKLNRHLWNSVLALGQDCLWRTELDDNHLRVQAEQRGGYPYKASESCEFSLD